MQPQIHGQTCVPSTQDLLYQVLVQHVWIWTVRHWLVWWKEMKLRDMSICYLSTLLRGLAQQHLAWLRCLWWEFWVSFELLCSSNHWSNWWVCFLLPAATSCLKHGETWWAVRWVWSLESCLSMYALYVCLTKHTLWCRIRPSLTSTQMILLLISMERSMRGRVSEFPHLFSVFLLGFLVTSVCCDQKYVTEVKQCFSLLRIKTGQSWNVQDF